MAFRSSSTATGSTATPGVAVPPRVQAGDLVLLAVGVDNVSDSFAQGVFPSGFTRLSEVDMTLDGHSAAIGYKRLTGADTGSYTFGSIGPAGQGWVCQAFAFSGRHASSAPTFATTTNNASNGPPVTVTAPTITALAGDDLLWVSAPDVDAAGIGNGHTPPSGYTERQDAESGDGWANLTGATRDNVTAGATGAVAGTFALTGGHSGWTAWNVRVPAAAGGSLTLAVGVAAEPDTSQPVGPRRLRGAATATDASTAFAVARAKRRAPAPAAEPNAALSVRAGRRRGIGIAAAANQALAVVRAAPGLITRAVGIATGPGAAQPLRAARRRLAGTAATTEAPRALTHVKHRALAPAAEAATALSLSAGDGTVADGAARAGRIAPATRGRIAALHAGHVNHGTRGLVA